MGYQSIIQFQSAEALSLTLKTSRHDGLLRSTFGEEGREPFKMNILSIVANQEMAYLKLTALGDQIIDSTLRRLIVAVKNERFSKS